MGFMHDSLLIDLFQDVAIILSTAITFTSGFRYL